MRLTNADVDQWLWELAITRPSDLLARDAVDEGTSDMIDALAREAQDRSYVYRAATALSRRQKPELPDHFFDRRARAPTAGPGLRSRSNCNS